VDYYFLVINSAYNNPLYLNVYTGAQSVDSNLGNIANPNLFQCTNCVPSTFDPSGGTNGFISVFGFDIKGLNATNQVLDFQLDFVELNGTNATFRIYSQSSTPISYVGKIFFNWFIYNKNYYSAWNYKFIVQVYSQTLLNGGFFTAKTNLTPCIYKQFFQPTNGLRIDYPLMFTNTRFMTYQENYL